MKTVNKLILIFSDPKKCDLEGPEVYCTFVGRNELGSNAFSCEKISLNEILLRIRAKRGFSTYAQRVPHR